jgi:predicted RNase H-like nuclease (RuvC/YqgF family)
MFKHTGIYTTEAKDISQRAQAIAEMDDRTPDQYAILAANSVITNLDNALSERYQEILELKQQLNELERRYDLFKRQINIALETLENTP